MAESIGDVTARLTLDTAQFDTSMKKSDATVSASTRSMQMSNEKMAAAVALTAKFAGDAVTTQSLRIVAARQNEKLASLDMQKASALLKAGYNGEAGGANLAAAALQRLTAAKLETAAASAMEALAVETAGHASVSQMMATSAAVRSLEGNPGIRATERFLTTIPGVGKALQMAFPLIGGIAFGAMIFELIKKVYDFNQATKQAAKEISDGFEQINDATRKAGVSLDITSDKLQIQIAKLEHKPENLLKLALDESRLSAFELTEQLRKSNEEVAKFMEQKSVNLLKQMTSGLLSSRGQEVLSNTAEVTAANNANSRITRVQTDAQDRMNRANPGTDRDAVEKANRTVLVAAFDTEINLAKKYLDQLYGYQREAVRRGTNDDYSARTSTAEGQLAHLQTQRGPVATGFQVTDQGVQLKADQDVKQKAEEAKQRAAAARSAMQKANELQMKSFESGSDQMQADYGKNLSRDAAYWNGKLATLKIGSANFDAVQKKATAANEAESKNLDKQVKTYRDYQDEQAKAPPTTTAIDKWMLEPVEDLTKTGPRWKGYNEEMAKSLEIMASIKSATQLASIQVALATGTMDKHSAAIKIAANHAEGYAEKLKILNAELDKVNADTLLPMAQRDTAALGIKNTIDTTQGAADRQGAVDQQGIASSSALGGATDALREFIAATRDSSKQMHDFVTTSLSEFNRDLLVQITTRHPRQAFGNLGSDVARNVAGTALTKGEGALMSAIGLGGKKKPTGTSSDPLFVKLAGAANGAASGVGGAITAASGTGFWGKARGFATKLFPGYADGGVMTANSMAIVGERGPELFMPGSSGQIIPNHRLGGAGGFTQHYNIDARGTDPAQTEQRVRRAMQQTHQQSVSDSHKVALEHSRRSVSR